MGCRSNFADDQARQLKLGRTLRDVEKVERGGIQPGPVIYPTSHEALLEAPWLLSLQERGLV